MILALIMAAAGTPQWEETFPTLDPNRWEVQLYSFPANGCLMGASQVDTAKGSLKLTVAPLARPQEGKVCRGGEVGSKKYFKYGLFQVRMQPPAVRGGVVAFFLMNEWKPLKWEHKEIDFEFIGNRPNEVQLTNHDFQQGGTVWKMAATQKQLNFEFSSSPHDYSILWTATFVRWYVDGRLLHTETRYVPHEPLQIRANVYLGAMDQPGVEQWLGPIDPRSLPATALYSAIRYFPLEALPAGFDAGPIGP